MVISRLASKQLAEGSVQEDVPTVVFSWKGWYIYCVQINRQKGVQLRHRDRVLEFPIFLKVDYSFGNWVRRRRKALDLTRHELARRVGCSLATIVKIESDERRPSRQIAELLTEHLDIPLDQRELFVSVARRERIIDSLESISSHSTHQSLGSLGGASDQAMHASVAVPLQPSLPPTLTSFIGREHELRMIIRQIQDPACRLLTLTGPGGVGKTRLALEVTRQLSEEFSHGVYFVSLVGTSTSELIVPAIANTLGFIFAGAHEPKVQLFNFLKEKRVLLVLDNLEHLLDGIEWLDEMLEFAPGLRVLVTSREKLNLLAEWVFEVQGLPIPPNVELQNLESNSATALFLQRAKQAKVDFKPSGEDLFAIRRISQLVEGLPLALELAATWVNTLSCHEIAAEIEQGLDFLKSAKRDVPERHRSMRAVFDYSWKFLSTAEQAALKKLSVFQGGFRREAAERVADASLSLLSTLVGKSLVRRNESGSYDQHELVRQYAAEHLHSIPQEHLETQDRHSSYYAALLEQWEAEIRGPRQQEILAELGAELDNVRLAWKWMLDCQQTENIRKSLHMLWHFYEIHGSFQEGALIFGQGVAALQTPQGAGTKKDIERSVVLGRLLGQEGYFCAQLGQYEEAGQLLEQSLSILRSLGDVSALANTLTLFAYTKYRLGEFKDARLYAQESLALNRSLNNQVGIAYCFINLSYICLAEEAYERAYELSRESLAICRDILSDPHGTADSLITLSTAATRLGRYEEAKRWAEQGLQISQTLNDRWGIGQAFRELSLIRYRLGEAEQAEALIRQSVSQFREIGDRSLMAMALIELGVVIHAARKNSESKECLLSALRIAMDTQSESIALQAMIEIAGIEMEGGAVELAMELVEQCLKHPAANQEIKDRAGNLCAELERKRPLLRMAAGHELAQGNSFEAIAQKILSASG